jgi:putative ABC transport system permease protein
MLKNYLRTAYRHLIKDRMHSIINIAGLSIGMAVALLIGLWISDELNFNKNFAHYDRIAQVFTRFTINGERGAGNSAPIVLGESCARITAAISGMWCSRPGTTVTCYGMAPKS